LKSENRKFEFTYGKNQFVKLPVGGGNLASTFDCFTGQN
jgi:hypothetical protein